MIVLRFFRHSVLCFEGKSKNNRCEYISFLKWIVQCQNVDD